LSERRPVPKSLGQSDLDELLDILELDSIGNDVFVGRHPRKNPVRTFGGQLMAQAFMAATRTLDHELPPSALSVHFIAGGDPVADIEFHVVRLRDERRFANRRVDARQGDTLLATALVSYLSGG
jgi:acyl-CoA thioesterase-2